MQELNIISLFWQAGPVVKLVMLTLLLFSLASWTIVFQKYFLFKKLTKASNRFQEEFWNSKSLPQAMERAQIGRPCPESTIFLAGYQELQKLAQGRDSGSEVLATRLAGMKNLERVMARSEAHESGVLQRHLSFLATTGSATPFIGLFGTVWGIMVSFNEIGAHGSASLAVVAPGISEALVATAAGLAVAIPAVVFYNHFNHKLEGVEGAMASFSADFLNLVERDLLSKD
ncbi:MAG: protein TolQ [Thermodesulfobacteriota bacterium]